MRGDHATHREQSSDEVRERLARETTAGLGPAVVARYGGGHAAINCKGDCAVILYMSSRGYTSRWSNVLSSATSEGRNGMGMKKKRVMRNTAPEIAPKPSGLHAEQQS